MNSLMNILLKKRRRTENILIVLNIFFVVGITFGCLTLVYLEQWLWTIIVGVVCFVGAVVNSFALGDILEKIENKIRFLKNLSVNENPLLL